MKIPRISSDYINIYKPRADVYLGKSSKHLVQGITYEHWIPNDHLFIKGDDHRWHGYGITHPYLPEMEDDIHEAEWQSFHCVSPKGSLKDFLTTESFEDHQKILYPQTRPNESEAQHAPAIVKKDNLWHMFYGPETIRYATSTDLFNWQAKGGVFTDHQSSRDPHIYYENGTYYLTYCRETSVMTRTSTDLLHFSEPTEIFSMRRSGNPESPVLLKHEDYYYLLWCIWDETEEKPDPYDARTFVYASKNPLDFKSAPQVASLYGHAPEIIVDEDGDYFITSAHKPFVGINIAHLEWIQY
ncbi:MAG: family 43 glycosylhydrolase [Lachnospiraceae bacterium]